MSAETPVQSAGTLTRTRLRFRDWRGNRPFWAGLFTLLAGVPIAYFPYATLNLGHMSIALATTGGAGSLIIGVLLVTLGLTMWFQQIIRVFSGVAAIVLSLVSLVVSNFGGFVIGFLLALVGGALAISWAPGEPEPQPAERAPKGDGGAPEGDGGAPEGVAPDTGALRPVDAVGEPNDLSGTSPANGANGRHSAG